MEQHDMNTLHGRTLVWADEKGLNQETGDPFKQLAKLTEEVGELNSAVLRWSAKEDQNLEQEANIYKAKAIDAIGDVAVSLDVLGNILGLDLNLAWNVALSVIEQRKGKAVNGSFTKEED